MKPIGKSSELIKQIRKAKTKNLKDNIAYVEQIGVLEKFLQSDMLSRFKVKATIICEELIDNENTIDIKNKLIELSSDVYSVSASVFDSICEKKNNAGIFCLIEFVQYSISEFSHSDFKKIIVLDGLETPGNIGTIFRTADACGIDAIVCTDQNTMVYSKKCISSSRGMVFYIPCISLDYKNTKELLASNDYSIYLCEPEQGKSYDDIEYDEKSAVVFGSERFGINDDWFNTLHKRIFIPMVGSMTSLNVGVAASIIMYECMKNRD